MWVGRIVYGLGAENFGVANSSIVADWFIGDEKNIHIYVEKNFFFLLNVETTSRERVGSCLWNRYQYFTYGGCDE